MLLAGLGQALALVIHAWAPGMGDWIRQAWSALRRLVALVPRITSPRGLPARRAAWRASRSRRGRRRG
jgi:hypothetical protein